MNKRNSKIKINCPECGRALRGVTNEMLGEIGVCSKCKTEFIINESKLEVIKKPHVSGESIDWKPQDVREDRITYWILLFIQIAIVLGLTAVRIRGLEGYDNLFRYASLLHFVLGIALIFFFLRAARLTLGYSIPHLILLAIVVGFVPFVSFVTILLLDRSIIEEIKQKEEDSQKADKEAEATSTMA